MKGTGNPPPQGRTDKLAAPALLLRLILGVAQVGVMLAVSAVGATAEQTGSVEESKGAVEPVQPLEKRLAEARINLAAAEGVGDRSLTSAPAGISMQDIATRRALLSRLVRLLEQQQGSATELETTKTRLADLARKAGAWTRFADPPPYSILLADRLREELQGEQLKSASGQAAVSTIDQFIGENRTELTQTEEKLRQLNEQLEAPKDPADVARLSWRRDLERLRGQVAVASLGVLDSERQIRQVVLEESRIRADWLQRQLIIADADARFMQTDLDQVTARIESDRQGLERELTEAQLRLSTAQQAVQPAREDLREFQARPGAAPRAIALRAETLATREAQLETTQSAVRMLRLMLESENVERAMWEMRFAAFDSRSVETLSESERRLGTFIRRLNLWRDFEQQQREASPSQVELQEARVRDLAPDSELLPLARERLGALREREHLLQRLVRRIEQVQRLSQRWTEGLRVTEGHLPFLSRLRNMCSDAGSFAHKLWSFELFTAEDTITVEGQKITGKRSVTLGKVVMALLILGLGIWITGLISRVTEPIIMRRLNIEPNQANLIRRWFRAFMILCLVMFSLVSVKIPLTVFAFAGGALAIGLGFGTQTILKNFVSGLILLFERPFRVGDVLEVGSNRGTVTEIGLRASVLQLWDGTETLIPNSSLLENNVSNWTYTNRKVRFTVTVGAAYGSDTRRVIQLMSEVAERHGVVEKDPKPQVLFTEFGESALTFELRYWVDVIKANAAQVGSDLRQMIAGAFAENGIVIAFPQRDLHLDTARPLTVEIVTSPDQNKKRAAKLEFGEQGANSGEINVGDNF
jgi:small-conductance mechanosensitive channel